MAVVQKQKQKNTQKPLQYLREMYLDHYKFIMIKDILLY